VVHQPVSRGLAVFAVGLACGDQRQLTGNGSASEVVLHDDALYKSTTLLYFFFHRQSLSPQDISPENHFPIKVFPVQMLPNNYFLRKTFR